MCEVVAAAIASALTADKLCVCILGNWYRDLYSVFDVQYVYTYMCIEGECTGVMAALLETWQQFLKLPLSPISPCGQC